jgi:hypothetical protein
LIYFFSSQEIQTSSDWGWRVVATGDIARTEICGEFAGLLDVDQSVATSGSDGGDGVDRRFDVPVDLVTNRIDPFASIVIRSTHPLVEGDERLGSAARFFRCVPKGKASLVVCPTRSGGTIHAILLPCNNITVGDELTVFNHRNPHPSVLPKPSVAAAAVGVSGLPGTAMDVDPSVVSSVKTRSFVANVSDVFEENGLIAPTQLPDPIDGEQQGVVVRHTPEVLVAIIRLEAGETCKFKFKDGHDGILVLLHGTLAPSSATSLILHHRTSLLTSVDCTASVDSAAVLLCITAQKALRLDEAHVQIVIVQPGQQTPKAHLSTCDAFLFTVDDTALVDLADQSSALSVKSRNLIFVPRCIEFQYTCGTVAMEPHTHLVIPIPNHSALQKDTTVLLSNRPVLPPTTERFPSSSQFIEHLEKASVLAEGLPVFFPSSQMPLGKRKRSKGGSQSWLYAEIVSVHIQPVKDHSVTLVFRVHRSTGDTLDVTLQRDDQATKPVTNGTDFMYITDTTITTAANSVDAGDRLGWCQKIRSNLENWWQTFEKGRSQRPVVLAKDQIFYWNTCARFKETTDSVYKIDSSHSGEPSLHLTSRYVLFPESQIDIVGFAGVFHVREVCLVKSCILGPLNLKEVDSEAFVRDQLAYVHSFFFFYIHRFKYVHPWPIVFLLLFLHQPLPVFFFSSSSSSLFSSPFSSLC